MFVNDGEPLRRDRPQGARGAGDRGQAPPTGEEGILAVTSSGADTVSAGSKPVSGAEETLAVARSGADAVSAGSEPVSGAEETLLAEASGRGAASEPQGGARLPALTGAPGAEGEDLGDLVTVSRAHYTRGREFARGGMGRVVAARDRRLGRPVALKELLVGRPDLRRRFEREARITGRLQHPSIVPIYEHGRWPSGEPFYAMKHITGRPLSQLVAEARTPADRLALLPRITAVAEAVAYAHSQGVIHRDLKPGNVLVGEYGETVVIDWGLAKELGGAEPGESKGGEAPRAPEEALDVEGRGRPGGGRPARGGGRSARGRTEAEKGSAQRESAQNEQAKDWSENRWKGGDGEPGELTVVGSVMGTPAFMPPEQARGEPVDERADVYALGAILYNCLSGSLPYVGKTSDQVIRALVDGPPPPLGSLQPDLPPDLLSLVDKAMAPSPRDRYATAGELAADLRRFQRGQLVGAHRYGGAALFWRWVRRNRVVVGISAGFVAALLSLGVVGLRRIVAERDRAEAERQRAEAASIQARDRAREAREHAQAATGRLATFFADEGRREQLAGHPERALAYLAEARRLGDRSLSAQVLLGLAAREVTPQKGVVEGHSRPVEAVTFSPDGRALYTAGQDRLLRRWSVPGLRLERTRAFGGFPLSFSPDGSQLLVGQRDRPSLALLRVRTGRQECSLVGEGQGAILRVAWSADGRRVAGWAPGGQILVWDLSTCTLAGRLPFLTPAGRDAALHLPRLFPAALSADGERVAILKDGLAVEIREVISGRLISVTVKSHHKPVTAFAFAPKGAVLATGSEDGALMLWDARTGQASASLEPHPGGVTAVLFGPHGQRLASAGLDGTVRLHAVASGETIAVLRGHRGAVKRLWFSRDGGLLLSAGDDHLLSLWDGKLGGHRGTFRGHLDHVTGAAFDPKGIRAASVGHDNRVRLWDATGEVVRHIVGKDVHLATVDPSGQRILLADRKGGIQVVSTEPGGRPLSLVDEGEQVTALAFCAQGQWGAVGRDNLQVEVWDIASGSRRLILKGHEERVTHVAFDPKRRWVATASWDETVRLWDAGDGKLLRVLGGHNGEVLYLVFDPKGGQLATVSADGLVRLWDPERGALRAALGVTGAKLLGTGFVGDGSRIVTVSEALRLITWDATRGTMVSSAEGQGGDFSWARFAAKGALLVTSTQGAASLVDASSGKLLLPMEEGGYASVSQDGSLVVTVDRKVHVATLRRIPAQALPEDTLARLVAAVPWRVRKRGLVREAEVPDWVRFPPSLAPPPFAPLLADASLGLGIEALPGWGMATTPEGHNLERRLGERVRLQVEVALGKPVTLADTDGLAEIIRKRELGLRYGVASHWGTFAGLPAVTLQGPHWTQEASLRYVSVLAGERPLIFTLALEGASFESPEARLLISELQGAIRFTPPWQDTPDGRRAGLPLAVGGVTVHPGEAWRLTNRGPGGVLVFEGPEGAKADVRVLGPTGEGAVWCERGEPYPTPSQVTLSGVPALRYLCPQDPADQVFYVMHRGGHMIYVGLTDPKTQALSGPVTQFPGFLRFGADPPWPKQ